MAARLHHRRRPLAMAVILALAATGAQAATITVMGGGDSGDISTCTLRQAIDSVNNASLTGSGCVNGSVDAFGTNDTIVFDSTLKDSTITLGGSQLEIDTSVSIIGAPLTIDAAGLSRVLYIKNQGESVYLSALLLTNGNAGAYEFGSVYGGGGGGICAGFVYGCGAPIIAASTQRPTKRVPLLYSDFRVVLEHVVVSGNSAGNLAGGIYARWAHLTLNRSIVVGNTVDLVTGCRGSGGIYSSSGLRYGSYGILEITDSTIAGNSAHTNASNLCGLLVAGGLVTIYENQAVIANTTISGNSATGARNVVGGFAARFATGNNVLTSCTVSGNTATVVSAGTASPAASYYAAGGILIGGYYDSASLYNSIVAGNGAGGSDLVITSGGAATVQYSLLGTASSPAHDGNGNVFADDPKLDVLVDNGGSTPTRALMQGSPALNVGNPALALAPGFPGLVPLNYDQRGRGFPRMLGDTIDIGAFQHQTDRIFADGLEAEP